MSETIDIITASRKILSNEIEKAQEENYFFKYIFTPITKKLEFLISKRKFQKSDEEYIDFYQSFQHDILIIIIDKIKVGFKYKESNAVRRVCEKILYLYETKYSGNSVGFFKYFSETIKYEIFKLWQKEEPDKEKVTIKKYVKEIIKHNSKIKVKYANQKRKYLTYDSIVSLLKNQNNERLQYNDFEKIKPEILSEIKIVKKQPTNNLDIRNIIEGGKEKLEIIIIQVLKICNAPIQYEHLIEIILELIIGERIYEISYNKINLQDENNLDFSESLISESEIDNFEKNIYFIDDINSKFKKYKIEFLDKYKYQYKMVLFVFLKNFGLFNDKNVVERLCKKIKLKKSSVYNYVNKIKNDLLYFFENNRFETNPFYSRDYFFTAFLVKVKLFMENENNYT